ncbi:MAG: alpha/beta fold hydrolase [Polaromonas sp.]
MTLELPAPVQLPGEATTLLKSATRIETPCETGSLVWHSWGQDACNPALAPLVLLHGGSGSWTHWLRNIAALAESGRRVLVPDLPGFGDSSVPLRGTDADAMPELLEQGLQCLLGSEACDLAGFSFGGMVAGLVAAQFPARVARLVLVGAPGLGIAPEKAVRLNAWRHLKEAAQRDAVHRSNLAALMLHHPESITELALRLHVANVLRDRMKGRSLSRTDVLARTLADVQCPVHAIYGAEDALYRGRMQALEPALRQAPGFRALTLIDGAGHWVQFERADAFDKALLATLNLD